MKDYLFPENSLSVNERYNKTIQGILQRFKSGFNILLGKVLHAHIAHIYTTQSPMEVE